MVTINYNSSMTTTLCGWTFLHRYILNYIILEETLRVE